MINLRGQLPPEMNDGLARLDPMRGHPPVEQATLAQMAADLIDGESETELTIESTPQRLRTHRPGARVVLAVLTSAVLAAGLAVAIVEFRSSNPVPRPAGPLGVTQLRTIPAAYQALANQTNPLSAGMHVDCNGVAVAVPLLAAPGGAETGTSSSSVALRRFLAHNPFAGMGTVTTNGWVLLARTTDRLTFGQRTGPIGMGPVVTLTRQGSSFNATGEGGCGPVIPGRSEAGEPVEATVSGSGLILRWENSSNCGTGTAKADRTLARVLLMQTRTAVNVLLISKPSPDAGPTPAGHGCAGVGLSSTTRVRLDAPLGARTLIDNARVPGATVHIDR